MAAIPGSTTAWAAGKAVSVSSYKTRLFKTTDAGGCLGLWVHALPLRSRGKPASHRPGLQSSRACTHVAVCSHAGLTWAEATTSFSNQIEVYGISFNEADSRKIYFVGSQST